MVVANHTSNQEIGVGAVRAGPTQQLESEPFGATGADSIAPEAWPITLDGNRAPCLQLSSPSADHIAINAPKMQDSRLDEMLDIIAHLTSPRIHRILLSRPARNK